MEPIKFKEANKKLVKPDNMTDEECSSLYIYTDGGACVSCWKPSLRERMKILFTGEIWLSILSGDTQPPVSVSVYSAEMYRAYFRLPTKYDIVHPGGKDA